MQTPTSRRSVIVQGEFGRATLKLTSGALVEHAHSEFNFVFMIGGGNTGFRVADAKVVLRCNQAVLVNPWEPHAKLESEAEPTCLLALLLNPAWVLEAAKAPATTASKIFANALVDLTPAIREDVARLALALTLPQREALGPAPLVRSIVQQVFQQYTDASRSTQAHFARPAMDARVARATRYMRERVADNPGLENVAREVGLSRSRFFEQFKNCMGVSPQQYVDSQRMAMATEMLGQPELPIAEVSHRLGFAAPSHFARFFALHTGFPPRDFRRGVRESGTGSA